MIPLVPVSGSDEGVTFSHLSYLSQYLLYNNTEEQSLLDINVSYKQFPIITKELVACLNSLQGGVIYLGVTKQGTCWS